MQKDVRQRKIKLRKNFFPTLVLSSLFWLGIASYVYFVEPNSFWTILGFFILFFVCFLFTISALFANSRIGFLASIGITFFLILRYFGLGNILNLVLITGVVVSLEFYLSR